MAPTPPLTALHTLFLACSCSQLLEMKSSSRQPHLFISRRTSLHREAQMYHKTHSEVDHVSPPLSLHWFACSCLSGELLQEPPNSVLASMLVLWDLFSIQKPEGCLIHKSESLPCSTPSLLTQSQSHSSWVACTVTVIMPMAPQSLLCLHFSRVAFLPFLKHTQKTTWPWSLLLFPSAWKTVPCACSEFPDIQTARSLTSSSSTLKYPLWHHLHCPVSSWHPSPTDALWIISAFLLTGCLPSHKDKAFAHLFIYCYTTRIHTLSGI